MKNLIKIFPLLLLFACQKETPKPTLEIPSTFVFDKLDFGESKYFTFENGKPVEIEATGSFLDFESTLKNSTLERPDFWQTEKMVLLNESDLRIEYTPNSFFADTTLGYFLRDQEVVIETGVSWFPELSYQLNSDFTELSFCYESIYSSVYFDTTTGLGQGTGTSQPCGNNNHEELVEKIMATASEPFTDSDTIAINFSRFVFNKE